MWPQPWQQGMEDLTKAVTEVRREADRRFPDWNVADAPSWSSPMSLPPAIRFGEIRPRSELDPEGISRDSDFAPRGRMQLPPSCIALIFPVKPQSMSRCEAQSEEGRRQAIDVMQGVMLRFLTGLPPGKVRFTIIDPVGLWPELARVHASGRLLREPWSTRPGLDGTATD